MARRDTSAGPKITLSSLAQPKPSARAPNPIEGRLKAFYTEAQGRLEKQLNTVDGKNIGRLYECAEYAETIFHYLRERERDLSSKANCLEIQADVKDEQRAATVDWIVEVHGKHKMEAETLYLSINILDRYLQKDKITKGRLQLVALAALLIAAKYEEIYPPTLSELMANMTRSCMKEEVLHAESNILRRLDYDLSVPSILRFLERYSRLLQTDEVTFHLALYLAELQLLQPKMFQYPPSQLAAGALYLAHKLLSKGTAFNELVAKQAQLLETQVQQCAREMLHTAQASEQSSLQAIKKKYSSSKLKQVALLKLNYSLAI